MTITRTGCLTMFCNFAESLSGEMQLWDRPPMKQKSVAKVDKFGSADSEFDHLLINHNKLRLKQSTPLASGVDLHICT